MNRGTTSSAALVSAPPAAPASFVFPGDMLPHRASEVQLGEGVYLDEESEHLRASRFGVCTLMPASGGSEGPLVVTVMDPTRRTVVPEVPQKGDIVIGRVLKISDQRAHVELMLVHDTSPLQPGYEGIVRVSEVRATQLDQVEMQKSFRAGDLIRAMVVAMGDRRSYVLSTARNELGVIQARSSISGRLLLPFSWTEMICPITKTKEFRKVAKFSLFQPSR